ncbi:MAG: hypothetical protein RRB13_06420 [bacterium]|nr:hypothetical protein [bacterium]
MDQILNERSLEQPYQNRSKARQGIKQFVELSLLLKKFGFSTGIRTTRDFSTRPLTPDRSVYDCIYDRENRGDPTFQLFLTMVSKAPFIEDLLENRANYNLVEYKYHDAPALGLALAHQTNNFVLSFQGDQRFEADQLQLEMIQFCNEQIESSLVLVPNLSCAAQAQKRQQEILNLQGKVKSGADLVQQAVSRYPFIALCDSAKKQLMALNGSELYFSEIQRHLQILNDTMQSWEAGPFSPEGLTWSFESQPTMTNSDLKAMRTFRCPDGSQRICERHTKMMSANQRIHFLPLQEEGKVLIGYVGIHLKTSKD